MRGFNKTLAGLFVLLLLAAPALPQQMKMHEAGEIFSLPEIGAVIAQEGDQIKILAALPKDRRVKAYENVDLQEGDLLLFLKGKRLKSVKEFEQDYAAMAIGDTLQIGLRRKEDRLITAFAKADPHSLPAPQMKKVMIGSDGTVTTTNLSGGKGQIMTKALEPNASEITPVMAMGAVIGSVDGNVKILDKLPFPAKELENVDLQEGDVLQALNGRKIANVAQFNEDFEKIAAGAKVDLQYARKDKIMTASFTKPQAQGRMIFRTESN